jgi:hypothetical protein
MCLQGVSSPRIGLCTSKKSTQSCPERCEPVLGLLDLLLAYMGFWLQKCITHAVQ